MEVEYKCKTDGCSGKYRFVDDYDEKKSLVDGGCSCFENPPCSWCTNNVYVCDECGDIEEYQC